MGDRGMSRREFLAVSAAAGAGLVTLGRALAQGEATGDKSLVIRSRRADAFAGGEVPEATVTDMVNAVVRRLAGKDDGAEAWAQFVGPEDMVGIKVNCLFGYGASTHLAVVNAIVAGCQAAGVAPERIIIWDRTTGDMAKTGYPVNREGKGVRCYGTDGDYEANPTVMGTFNGRLSRLLTRTITALINVPILKSHSISGVSISMKNHYGSFHNPGDFHGNACDPYMADINSVPAIRDKTRLIILDALFPVAHGGPRARPQYTWPYGGVLAATDTVAVDFTGLQILEARRKEIGLQPIGNQARHIATAAAKGLGTNDPARIELVDLS
ncbi:MAG: DUF362 domain-containing protein [Armatimonadetes bacterium]|nr:DUF362 domain-containing protein [Armatimonadota bacterium]